MARSSLTKPDAAAESSTRDRFYSILRKPASNLALRISDLDRYRLNMWEVSWAAPKESRKEHRENKATTATKTRSIFSRESNSSSETPSFGNFYKRKNAERGNDSMSSTSSKASAMVGNYELEADQASTFSSGSEQTTINMARVVDLNARRNGQILERSQGLRQRAVVILLMLTF
jgi:hypothetical protein